MTAVAPTFGRWIVALFPTIVMSAGAYWIDVDFIFFIVPVALFSILSGMLAYVTVGKPNWWVASLLGGCITFALGLALSAYLASQS